VDGFRAMVMRTHLTRTTTAFVSYRFALLLLLGVIVPSMANDRPPVYAVLVYKSERLLMLLHQGEIVGHYKISLGRNPVGPKLHEGDFRTPEGRYVLDWRNP